MCVCVSGCKCEYKTKKGAQQAIQDAQVAWRIRPAPWARRTGGAAATALGGRSSDIGDSSLNSSLPESTILQVEVTACATRMSMRCFSSFVTRRHVVSFLMSSIVHPVICPATSVTYFWQTNKQTKPKQQNHELVLLAFLKPPLLRFTHSLPSPRLANTCRFGSLACCRALAKQVSCRWPWCVYACVCRGAAVSTTHTRRTTGHLVLADGVVDEHALPPPLEKLGDVAVRHHPQQAANPLVKDAFTAQHVDVGVNYDLLGMPKPETNILGGASGGWRVLWGIAAPDRKRGIKASQQKKTGQNTRCDCAHPARCLSLNRSLSPSQSLYVSLSLSLALSLPFPSFRPHSRHPPPPLFPRRPARHGGRPLHERGRCPSRSRRCPQDEVRSLAPRTA